MTRNLPIVFKQTEYFQPLGTSTNTIAADGCYLCSLTTLAFACGKKITPPELNMLFTQKSLYVQQDLMVDGDLTKIYPDLIFQETLHYESVAADLNKLKELITDQTNWVLLKLDLGNSNTHFVLCAGVNGVVSIADPMTGSIIDLASKYGDPAKAILTMIVYKGTPATIDSSALQSLQSQVDQAKQLQDSQQETITNLQTQLQAASNQSQTNTQGLSEQNSQLNQKVADLAKQNTEYETTITDLKLEMAELSSENASLADMVRKEADKNSTSIKEGVKSSNALSDLTNYIQGFIGYFKLKGMNEKQFIEYLCDEVIKLEKLRKTTETLQVQKDVRVDSPTVSMAIKAEEIKKKVPLWLTGLRVLGIVER